MYFRFIKLFILLLAPLVLLMWQLPANAADLLEVYQQALCSDPIFQQAIAQSLVTRDNVPISISAILPNLSAYTDPTVTRYGFSGTDYRVGTIGPFTVLNPRNLTQRTYTLNLTLTQPVFDFGLFTDITIQLENAKSACATLNAALQNLMVRITNAYFAILRDEEEITYTLASKRYYQFQLQQITDQYQAGIKTLTDVYTAKASYESSVAMYINANKRLANDKENLRVMTGIYYSHLSYLKSPIPLVLPQPANIDAWTQIAICQNWSIKAAWYTLQSAKQNIQLQFAGHFPTVSLQSSFSREYTFNIDRYSAYIDNNGAGTTSDRSIGLVIDFPIFSGGGVVAKTNQAKHFYQQQQHVLDESIRSTINSARQSFTNIVAGASQIKADIQVIHAAVHSLQGTIDSYQAGKETLLDVLNREESLFQAQLQYASDRYDYINNIVLLKEAAGTLNVNDLRIINSWLIHQKTSDIRPFQDTLLQEAETRLHQNLKQLRQRQLQQKMDVKDIQGDHKQQPLSQNPTDWNWLQLIAQIRNEAEENYQKLADENKQNIAEINQLKKVLAELKLDLQRRSDGLAHNGEGAIKNSS